MVTHSDRGETEVFREAIAELKEQIQGWQENPEGFLWQVEFPEVFQEGVVLILLSVIRHTSDQKTHQSRLKPTLKRQFPEVYTGTADLYIYFYKRGTRTSPCRSGILTYISSNTVSKGSSLARNSVTFFTDRSVSFTDCLILGVSLFLRLL